MATDAGFARNYGKTASALKTSGMIFSGMITPPPTTITASQPQTGDYLQGGRINNLTNLTHYAKLYLIRFGGGLGCLSVGTGSLI